jgi:hypothetical protein
MGIVGVEKYELVVCAAAILQFSDTHFSETYIPNFLKNTAQLLVHF